LIVLTNGKYFADLEFIFLVEALKNHNWGVRISILPPISLKQYFIFIIRSVETIDYAIIMLIIKPYR
jgi:hypothetical protein